MTAERPGSPGAGASETKLAYLARWATGKTALDIGAGGGAYSTWLRDHGFQVVALDLDPAPIPGVEVHRCDVGRAWPIDGRRFDTVLAFDLVEHVEEEDSVLDQIAASAAHRLLLSVPKTDPGFFKSANLTFFHYTDRTHRRTYERDEIVSKLERRGFRILNARPQGPVMPHVVSAFARWRWFGWLLDRAVSAFLALGLLQTRYHADIFIVAEKAR